MIENERKFVLSVDPNTFLIYLIEKWNPKLFQIWQGYLSDNARIRKFKNVYTGEEVKYFTYKKKVEGSIVEIETSISDTDFQKLTKKVENVIHKTRAKIEWENFIWEIDFFKENENSVEYFFVMAEIELPEHLIDPPTLPKFISNNILYYVPLNDKRFQNRNLGDKKQIIEILKSLK